MLVLWAPHSFLCRFVRGNVVELPKDFFLQRLKHRQNFTLTAHYRLFSNFCPENQDQCDERHCLNTSAYIRACE